MIQIITNTILRSDDMNRTARKYQRTAGKYPAFEMTEEPELNISSTMAIGIIGAAMLLGFVIGSISCNR